MYYCIVFEMSELCARQLLVCFIAVIRKNGDFLILIFVSGLKYFISYEIVVVSRETLLFLYHWLHMKPLVVT